MIYTKTVEKWGVFEASVEGCREGNPFTDCTIFGTFENDNEKKTVSGFYDGDGIYKVRFMPSFEGCYSFKIEGSFSGEAFCGEFFAAPASGNNHGPVRVAHTFHFSYEDGTPYYPVGTTCYVWTHQAQEIQKQTLEELKKGYFNKIRFCVFPKHYDFNFREPISYPYEGVPCSSEGMDRDNFQNYPPSNPENRWDFYRFNPEHFRLFEKRIKDLCDLGIEADLIIMHPYDRWGFSEMPADADDLYWRYVIARFSAYRNVWWSLANEYDLLPKKNLRDWERYASILCREDPYHHLRSIHNAASIYDFTAGWVTHCCIQSNRVERVVQWRQMYGKPVILDELNYEGDIEHDFGNLTAKELVHRFWEVTLQGGYGGHGETYYDPSLILWWSHGGKLHGEAPERLKFLRKILEESPYHGLEPASGEWRTAVSAPLNGPNDYRLTYLGRIQPAYKRYHFDDVNKYRVEVIDAWDMTVTDAGVYSGRFEIKLPAKELMALRIRKIDE